MKPFGIHKLFFSSVALLGFTLMGQTAQLHCCASLTPISHIIVVVQENRSFNNLFMGYPGTTTSTTYTDGNGYVWPVSPQYLTQAYPSQSPDDYEVTHTHANFQIECGSTYPTACTMQGWGSSQCTDVQVTCAATCPSPTPIATPAGGPQPTPTALCAVTYVPQVEVQPYWDIATSYGIGDQVYQSNQGPSFPAHCYLIVGACPIVPGSQVYIAENNASNVMGCDAAPGTTVGTRNPTTNAVSSTFPCTSANSILNELDAAGLSWKYYVTQPYAPYWYWLWNGVDMLSQYGCTYGVSVPTCPSEYLSNVIQPPSQFLTDIANGHLANVTWITPTGLASDHMTVTNGSGPAWVLSVINAVGNSPFWNSTAIIVVWDDWGGLYDPEPPHMFNYYELGFRVPMLVVSPYTAAGTISHTTRESYGSILNYIEGTFYLPSLGQTDARSAGLGDFFNYQNAARAYSTLSYTGKFTPAYFLATMKHDHTVVDY